VGIGLTFRPGFNIDLSLGMRTTCHRSGIHGALSVHLDHYAGFVITVTFGLEHGLIQPREPGRLRLEVPAGTIDLRYETDSKRVTSVTIRNVPSYVAARDIAIEVPGFGPLRLDVAYGGNFYAIVEPQGPYPGLDALGAARLIELSRTVRALVRDKCQPVHPLDTGICGVTHVLWADVPKGEGADGRNAVFYGDRAIDRSPCGTGTSARLAHLAATGRLRTGDQFVHESYSGSRFTGRIEEDTEIAGIPAIIPSIRGSAVATGFNTIWVDRDDRFWAGFSVA
jgi:4-hydroxyproline epimerase